MIGYNGDNRFFRNVGINQIWLKSIQENRDFNFHHI
jgi:hypothetical protein